MKRLLAVVGSPPVPIGGAALLVHIIIITGSEVLLSRKACASWRAVQDDFEDYKTSLGPYPPAEALSYIEMEWPDLSPPAFDQLASFLAGFDEVAVPRFASS